MNKISFQKCSKADIPTIVRLHKLAYQEMVANQYGKWNDEEQKVFAERMFKKDKLELILYEGKTCGFIARKIENGTLYVANLGISPEFQNKSIGTKIVDTLKEQCKNENLTLRLDCFLTNTRAQKFYERNGLKVIGTNESHSLNEWQP